MKFLPPVCALAILGACCSLWWFALASAALLTWMHFALKHARASAGVDERRRLQPSVATLLSLVSYALLLSIAILTARAALGLLELPLASFEQAQLAPAMKRSSLGFYDKSELRLALAELALFTLAFSVAFVQAASHGTLRRRRALVLHPATAAFAFVLYFAAVRLPPYPVALEQWGPLIARAASDSAWPSLSGVSPVLLAAWLSWFGLSPLSLGLAAVLCNLVAGCASFVLIRRLTGSPVAAMFGASYALLEATTVHLSSVTFPAPAQVALAVLLIYQGLHPRPGFSWPVFLLGLIAPLDPLFGASASAGFLLALACQGSRPARLHVLAALLAGIGASVVTIAIARGVLAPVPVLNVAPVAEQELFAAPVLPLFIPGLLLLALVLRRRVRVWTVRRLFVCASLVCALASAYRAAGLLDPGASLQVYWILLPTVVLVIYGLVRAVGRAARAAPMRGAALSTGISALLFVVLLDVFFPFQRLNQVVARYAVGYEAERQKWYRNCASGKACDQDRKPTLAFYLREAARPLAESVGTKRGPA